MQGKKKKLNQYAILLDLKIISYITSAKNVKKDSFGTQKPKF